MQQMALGGCDSTVRQRKVLARFDEICSEGKNWLLKVISGSRRSRWVPQSIWVQVEFDMVQHLKDVTLFSISELPFSLATLWPPRDNICYYNKKSWLASTFHEIQRLRHTVISPDDIRFGCVVTFGTVSVDNYTKGPTDPGCPDANSPSETALAFSALFGGTQWKDFFVILQQKLVK